MSTPADRAADASWTADRERSNLWVLRLMRWIALTAGRRVSRWVLHPITLYFMLFGGNATRQSRRYLERALGRRATWHDVYKHIHTFAATVLDRVYFLQDRLSSFDVTHSDVHLIDERIARGEGAFMVGAHFGSFEALRALGHERDRVHASLRRDRREGFVDQARVVLVHHHRNATAPLVPERPQRLEAAEVRADHERTLAARDAFVDQVDVAVRHVERREAVLQEVDAVEHLSLIHI